MLDHDGARPQRWRCFPEEAGQNAVLKAFDIDLQRINVGHSGVAENALQPQRRHLDGMARAFARHDVAGAKIVAVGFDHQLAVGGAGRRGHRDDLGEAGGGAVERKPRMGDRMRFDCDHFSA